MSSLDADGILKPSDLPTPPQSALQLVQACSDPDIDGKRLSAIVTTDPVMTAELLRMVNSAFYALSREVRSVAHAVALIGQRALRNLVLCVTVRNLLRDEHKKGFDAAGYLDDMLRRAVSARLLGEATGADGTECFTAGLLQDLGMMVMIHAMPQHRLLADELRELDPDTRYRREQEVYGTTHDQVNLMLARAWALPEELALVMGYHHSHGEPVDNAAQRALCDVALGADWMAAMFSAADKPAVVQGCKAVLADRFQIDSDRCEALLQQVGANIENSADALGMRISHKVDFETVMREANQRLAEENISYQELVWRLEQTLAERDRLAAEVRRDLDLAREIQRSLLPDPQSQVTSITGINIPARAVSGDFFDYFPLDDGRIYFNVADVAGKGMNAALLMAKTISLFRCLGKGVRDPGELLARINNELFETSIHGLFVTMAAGVYDPAARSVRLVNAGHAPPLYLKPDGTWTATPASAPPLGIIADAVFPETTLSIDGGSLYLYTDGLTESQPARHSPLATADLVELFGRHAAGAPRERLVAIIDDLELSSDALNDDLTIVVVEES